VPRARGRSFVLALVLALIAMPAAVPFAKESPKAAEPPARVAIVLAPSPARAIKGKPFIERIAGIQGLSAIGFSSAIQGRYSPAQVLLDVSAGARVQTSLYDGDLPERIALEPAGAGGRIGEWPRIASRADTPPADIKPGILGQSIRDGGGLVAYVGIRGTGNREAIVAADRNGAVERVSLGPGASVGARALAAFRRASLVVVKLPTGGDGRTALRALLGARRPQDLVLAVQNPNAVPRRLLAAGAAGLSGGRDLRSESTRTDGLVITTDFAPTVLDRLGLPIPKAVAGEKITASGSRSAEDLVSLRKRLSAVGPHRWRTIAGGLLLAVGLVALVTRDRRRVGRCALLAALWLPGILLVTGAIAPPAIVELGLLGAAGAVLALLADGALPWPRAIALPAAVTVGAHVLDLMLGSTLIVRSLLGPNPLLGARFYGIGNELEITLAVTALLGLGAALAGVGTRAAVWSIAVLGALLAFLLSWGRLGADVGAALTLGFGVATAAVYAAGRGSLRSRAAVVLGAPALAVGLLAALDLATGGNAHFTRSVLRAGGLDELGQVAQRRFELSYSSLGHGAIGPLVILAAVAVVLGARNRKRLLANLEDLPAMRAGFYGALAAVIGAALTNDSGPVIFLIGTVYLALAVGYFQSMPNPTEIPRRKARASYSSLQ
jgi:hypothetical protein